MPVLSAWRDAIAYALAYALWIALGALSAVLLVLLKSAIVPLIAISLLRDPYYQMHTVELRGMITTFDRATLIVLAILWVVYVFWLEEWLRGSVREAREQRMRARLLGEGEPAAETGLQRWNLHLLPQRMRTALLFPAAALAIYLVLEGLSRLLVR
ncbi:MAG: hypothetical protein ACP5UQ_08615 [Anaerolineae bacterium]